METLRSKKTLYYGIALVALVFFLARTASIIAPPESFPSGETFTVYENESLKTISARLEEREIIRSALVFRMLVSFKGLDRIVKLGVYEFDEALSLPGVVYQLTVTGPSQPLAKITIPEGSTTEEVVDIITKEFPGISKEKILNLIRERKVDGKLFPSTYFLLPSTSEEKVIDLLVRTFDDVYTKTFAFLPKPKNMTTVEEVLSLAAILEGEAKTTEDMRIVSGILQKRLAIKMPLQVDVAKVTYKERGLPDVPINNPGVNAIHAVFNPTESSYLYYITGKDGTMYYAKTFEEHKRNIRNYLR